MIPRAHIIEWRKEAPWIHNAQVEQDLIISRAFVEIFSNPVLKSALAFRGGTALYKLFMKPPARYSEDIDLVQIRAEPAGEIMGALQDLLNPWLGEPKYKQAAGRVRHDVNQCEMVAGSGFEPLTYRLPAGQRLKDEDAVILGDGVAERHAVRNRSVVDEDIDVFSEAVLIVENVAAQGGVLFEHRLHHGAHRLARRRRRRAGQVLLKIIRKGDTGHIRAII